MSWQDYTQLSQSMVVSGSQNSDTPVGLSDREEIRRSKLDVDFKKIEELAGVEGDELFRSDSTIGTD